MGLYARHWAKLVRGCTFAERLLLYALADRHHDKSGKCYPGHKSLRFEMDCSDTYLRQLFQSLDSKKFLIREPRFVEGEQTTNQSKLNLDRWFPFHSEKVEAEEKRLLGFFRRSIESPEVAQGFRAVWIEKPKLPNQSNAFKRNGLTPRINKKRPYGHALWIALASDEAENLLIPHYGQIKAAIEAETHHKYLYNELRIWVKKPVSSDFD